MALNPPGNPSIRFEIDTAFRRLFCAQVEPWGLFSTGNMPTVQDFYGKKILHRFSGCRLEFDDQKRNRFLGSLKPFVEREIKRGFKMARREAMFWGCDEREAYQQARDALEHGIRFIFGRMQDIVRRLRGNANPDSVPVPDVTPYVGQMLAFLDVYFKSALQSALRKPEGGAAGTEKRRFIQWAGSERLTLAIVFTDVVGSTTFGRQLRDEGMKEVLDAHFKQGRRLIHNHNGYMINTIGDALMAAFRSAGEALDFAIKFHAHTGHKKVKIRVGVHIGPLTVKTENARGRSVDFAHRVFEAIKGSGIGVSGKAKEDIDQLGSPHHKRLKWQKRQGIRMKGFGIRTLWSLILPRHK